mgnify:CR=1 FL=1
MTTYIRLRTGKDSKLFRQFYENNYIGTYCKIDFDLKDYITPTHTEFNRNFYIPEIQKTEPDRSKISIGLNGGLLHTVCACPVDTIILLKDQKDTFHFAKIMGDYFFRPDNPNNQKHCRSIEWLPGQLTKESASDNLWKSLNAQGTMVWLDKHVSEIEEILNGSSSTIYTKDSNIEDAANFALEKHLEDFLVSNWNQTPLGKDYDILSVDGELVGQQYQTDTGPIDILAISKDKKKLVVIELKKGRASDAVVGQIQRYMGYVKFELAEPNQEVSGIIIALEDCKKIKRALSVANNIDFYSYTINFKLTQSVI